MSVPATNLELTQQLQTMQANLVTLELRLNEMLPRMEDSITKSTALSDDLNKKLATHLNPLIEADLKGVITKVNDEHKKMNQQLEETINSAITNFNQVQASYQSIHDTAKAEMRSTVAKLEYLNTQVMTQKHEFAAEKTQSELRYAQQQSQIAIASATSSTSSPGMSGKRTNEPMVTHKLLINKTSLDGSESHDVFDDWYTDMADDFELLMPGAKAIMKLAERSKEICNTEWMMKQDNAGLTCSISRELYSVLKKKTTLRARNQLKSLSENEGLEAWRLIRLNLSRKDGQRLQSEFDTLTSLPKMKVEDFSSFPSLQTRWESELLKFAAIDAEYRLGKFQQRNILYRSLPAEVQVDLDREQSRDEKLNEYDEMVKYLTSLSRTQRFQKTSAPKPFSANLVDDVEPPSVESPGNSSLTNSDGETYPLQEWVLDLNSDEGRTFIAQGNPLPQEAQEALYSVMKGKGKGWNSDKGKGKGKGWNGDKGKGKGKGWIPDKGKGKGKGNAPKGGYKGPCHICGEFGHYARECPQNQVHLVDESNWGQSYSNSNYQVALMLSDQPFTGYNFKFDRHVDVNSCNQSTHANADDWQTVGGKKLQLGSDTHKSVEPNFDNTMYFMPTSQGADEDDHEKSAPLQTDYFPSSAVDFKSGAKKKGRAHMPTFYRPKTKKKVRSTCDADKMSDKKFDKVLDVHINSDMHNS